MAIFNVTPPKSSTQDDWNNREARQSQTWKEANRRAAMTLSNEGSREQVRQEDIAKHSTDGPWDHLGSVATSPTPAAPGDGDSWAAANRGAEMTFGNADSQERLRQERIAKHSPKDPWEQ